MSMRQVVELLESMVAAIQRLEQKIIVLESEVAELKGQPK